MPINLGPIADDLGITPEDFTAAVAAALNLMINELTGEAADPEADAEPAPATGAPGDVHALKAAINARRAPKGGKA
jgi:hypothetical protein